MKVEIRHILDEKEKIIEHGLVLIPENEKDSKLIDEVMGEIVDGDGDHYLYIPSAKIQIF